MIQSNLKTMNKKILQRVLLIICFFSINAFAIEDSRVWKNIGPDGASISTLAISKSEPNIVYALAEANDESSLFKSVDGGVQWEFVQHDNRDFYFYEGLLVDPNNPQILFLLAEERGSFKQTILQSSDGGINWNEIKLKDGGINGSFIALNTPLSDSLRAVVDLKKGGRSIALSHDGGESWEVSETVINPIDDIKVDIVGIDPNNTKVIYGISKHDQEPSGEDLLYKSIDGGKTWSSIQPIGNLETRNDHFKFQIHSVNSNILYSRFLAKNISPDQIGAFVWLSSNDGGENWNSFGELSESLEIRELTLDDNLSNILFATVRSVEKKEALQGGFGYFNINSEMVIAKSINSGKNWELINLGVTVETHADDENRIVLNSKENQKLLLSSREGVFRSQNEGLDWQSSNRGLNFIGGMVSVTPDNTDVVHLVHNDLRNYKTIDGGKSWERISISGFICFDSDVIFNPKNNQEALCSPDHRKIYKSSDGGGKLVLIYR